MVLKKQYFCDKCGVEVTKDEYLDFTFMLYQRWVRKDVGTFFHPNKWVDKKENGRFGYSYDLCPKCMKPIVSELERFFEQLGIKLSIPH